MPFITRNGAAESDHEKRHVKNTKRKTEEDYTIVPCILNRCILKVRCCRLGKLKMISLYVTCFVCEGLRGQESILAVLGGRRGVSWPRNIGQMLIGPVTWNGCLAMNGMEV